MKDQINATKSASKEQQTIGRRELLKALTATAGAVTLTSLPGKWVTPLIEVGTLPAHAQASALVYFGNPPSLLTAIGDQKGPWAILVVVNGTTGIANVMANNRDNIMSIEINLNIDGTPSDAFSYLENPCEHDLPGALWSVDSYTLGDPSIRIFSDGESSWTVDVPLGTGILPDLSSCPN